MPLKRCVVLLSLMLAIGGNAWAFSTLDIPGELAEPGVKLVAIEFYATWCGPCQAAVPKWKALQAKYHARGLRLVVVSVQSAGSCANPDWTPDSVVCDADGLIAQRYKATQLPQAFLYNWQGKLVVQSGGVEQVEHAVDTYFQSEPRILIDDPVDLRGAKLPQAEGEDLKRLVRGELKRAAKLDLPVSEAERGALRELKAKGAGAAYNEEQRCAIGQEVAPNSLLKVVHSQTVNGDKLRLELFSIEKGCLTASAAAPISDGDKDAAVISAVSKLLRALSGEPVLPSGGVVAVPVVPVVKPLAQQAAVPAPAPQPLPADSSTLAQAQAQMDSGHKREATWKTITEGLRGKLVSSAKAVELLTSFLREFPEASNPHRENAQTMLNEIDAAQKAGKEADLPALVGMDPDYLRTKTEWLALHINFGGYGGGGEVGFVTLRWKHFLWEIVRGGGMGKGPGFGSSHGNNGWAIYGGTAFGVPIHLGSSGRNELRVETGIFAGDIKQYKDGSENGYSYGGWSYWKSYGPFILAEVSHVYHFSDGFAFQWGLEAMIPIIKKGNATAKINDELYDLKGPPHPSLNGFVGFRI